MLKGVTIFTTNTCAYCHMVKKYLNIKGVPFEEINLDDNPNRRSEALELSGVLSVPVTVVTKKDDTKEIIVGYNLAKLAPALV